MRMLPSDLNTFLFLSKWYRLLAFNLPSPFLNLCFTTPDSIFVCFTYGSFIIHIFAFVILLLNYKFGLVPKLNQSIQSNILSLYKFQAFHAPFSSPIHLFTIGTLGPSQQHFPLVGEKGEGAKRKEGRDGWKLENKIIWPPLFTIDSLFSGTPSIYYFHCPLPSKSHPCPIDISSVDKLGVVAIKATFTGTSRRRGRRWMGLVIDSKCKLT